MRIRHVLTGYWLHFEPRAPASDALAAAADASASSSAAAAREAEPTNLMATRVMRDEDVFGLASVGREEEDDINLAKTTADQLRAFYVPFRTPGALAERSACDFKPLIRMLSELIVFVTSTDEPDPMKREGLPIFGRQMLLREQGVFALALMALTEPFQPHLFAIEDIGGHNGHPTGQAMLLKRSMILALRLCRHMLRDNSSNKRYMVGHARRRVIPPASTPGRSLPR